MDTHERALRSCRPYRHWYFRGERALGLPYRAIRAAVSALLLAAAVGTGGMAGMRSALAAEPGMVGLAGTVVDGTGTPLGGIHLVITEELPPDGGAAAFQVVTGSDGSFAVDVHAWGTAAAPASLSVATPPGEELEIVGDSCSQTWGVEVRVAAQVALADAAPEPLAIAATTTLLGEVCGTTGTPGGNSGPGGGEAQITPPPTDLVVSARGAGPDRLGPSLVVGFTVGLLGAVVLLPRPGARRRG